VINNYNIIIETSARQRQKGICKGRSGKDCNGEHKRKEKRKIERERERDRRTADPECRDSHLTGGTSTLLKIGWAPISG